MINQKEIRQIVRWTGIWVWSFFIAFNLREMIMERIPNPIHQIILGIVGMLVWAQIFTLTKYSG